VQAPQPSNAASGPTTNKRSIESNVVVDDGSIVVLGGLLAGQLCRQPGQGAGAWRHSVFGRICSGSETRSRKKTNLMVFLRPVVVRDAEHASTPRRWTATSMMRSQQQQDAQPRRRVMLMPMNSAVVMPALPPCAGRPTRRAAPGHRRTEPQAHGAPRYPLPYAFAHEPAPCCWKTGRRQLTLWLHDMATAAAPAPSAEVLRKFDAAPGRNARPPNCCASASAAAYAQGESSAATVVGEVRERCGPDRA